MLYKKQKLKNGLTLITSPLKETKAVTLLVLLPVGSRYEAKNINGVSHFIEHLMFKGTKKRPTSLDITKELNSVGAEFNAFTGKDHTGYYVKVSAEHIDLAFDILSDMLFNSLFDEKEINKERGVIIEEINMYEDNPLMFLPVLFEQTLFGNHPLGWMISGPRQVIKKISRREILNYKRQFYQPKNMIVGVAGNFNKAKVLKMAEKYFSAGKANPGKTSFIPLHLKQSQPRISLKYKQSQQVQLGLGFPAFSLKDKKINALYLLGIILGGNMSSRLFESVREKHGLAYYIKADIDAYQDTGAFLIQAGLDKKRIKQAIGLIVSELKKITQSGVTDKELADAKEYFKGRLILELEDSAEVADWLVKQDLLLNKILTPDQKFKEISKVTGRDVMKVAQEVIREKKINMALIGPYKNKDEFRKLLKF